MELKLTKQKNETRFFSGELKICFSIMFVALLLSFTQNVNAQVPDWEWAKGIGGTGNDVGMSIAVDGQGNLFTTGFFQGKVDFDPGVGVYNLTSAGSNDIFITKFDYLGNFVWAKRIGGTGNDIMDESCHRIVVDNLGDVYITGEFDGTTDFDPGVGILNFTSAGDMDFFICKLDNSGNLIWAKAIGGTGAERSFGIITDENGFVYNCGSFSNTVDFDPGSGVYNFTSKGSLDLYVTKFDNLGNFIWAKQIGGANWQRNPSITSDAKNNIYISGRFASTCDFDPGPAIYNLTSSGSDDIFILKLDDSGNFSWAKRIGSGGDDHSRVLIADEIGNTYTGCTFQGTVDFDPGAGTFYLTSGGGYNSAVTKLDSSGNFIWAKHLKGNSSQAIYALALDLSNNIYLTGNIYSTIDFDPGPGVFNLTAAGCDAFTCKLDNAGNFMWARLTGNTGFEYTLSSATDALGNLYVTGLFDSPTIPFDNTTITNHGARDIFIAKIPGPLPTLPRNCSEILKKNPAAPSGVYTIDPDGPGALPSMSCNCDMTTDGGGWTLVLNYNRLSGTDPLLNIFTNALPLQNNTTPGFDESNTPYWGHAGNALMSAIPFDELRFYGVTTNHNRVMNFKTNHKGTVSYFKTGTGSMNGIKSQFTPLSGHSTHLPASANGYYTNNGDNAMIAAPFYTISSYHWLLKHGTGDGACSNIANRWELDDFPCTLIPSTFHQIWVRQGATDPCVNVSCNISPGVYATNVLNTACNNGTIKVKRGNGVYNFYPHIELYKDTNLVTFIDLSPGTAEYTFANLIPGKYTVKVSDGLCCQSTFIRNIKCRAPSSGFLASNITATSAQLKWNVANCAEGYRVLYRKKGTTTWSNKGVNTNTGMLNLSGLQPQTSYEWKVGTKCNGWPEIMDILAYSPIQNFTTNALRMGEVITQSNDAAETFEINLFPNPATYTLTVNFEGESEMANLKVINMLGEVVLQKQVFSADGYFETQMNIADLKSGMYMLKVETENGESRKVFVKE